MVDWKRTTVAVAAAVLLAGPAAAAPIAWAEWVDVGITSGGQGFVAGKISSGSTTIDVTYIGPFEFAQLGTTDGTNYWEPSDPYISSDVPNPPPHPGIIALNQGGTKVITFSQPVVDPVLALVSWNGNEADFGVPIQILSAGPGYWGNFNGVGGDLALNDAGTGFIGIEEAHGTIRLSGTFTSITFTDLTEFWHGFTVGITRLASVEPDPTPVPEPGTLALLGLGLLGLAGVRRVTAA